MQVKSIWVKNERKNYIHIEFLNGAPIHNVRSGIIGFYEIGEQINTGSWLPHFFLLILSAPI